MDAIATISDLTTCLKTANELVRLNSDQQVCLVQEVQNLTACVVEIEQERDVADATTDSCQRRALSLTIRLNELQTKHTDLQQAHDDAIARAVSAERVMYDIKREIEEERGVHHQWRDDYTILNIDLMDALSKLSRIRKELRRLIQNDTQFTDNGAGRRALASGVGAIVTDEN